MLQIVKTYEYLDYTITEYFDNGEVYFAIHDLNEEPISYADDLIEAKGIIEHHLGEVIGVENANLVITRAVIKEK